MTSGLVVLCCFDFTRKGSFDNSSLNSLGDSFSGGEVRVKGGGEREERDRQIDR